MAKRKKPTKQKPKKGDPWYEPPMSEWPKWMQRRHELSKKALNEVAEQHRLLGLYRKSGWKKKPQGYKELDDSGI